MVAEERRQAGLAVVLQRRRPDIRPVVARPVRRVAGGAVIGEDQPGVGQAGRRYRLRRAGRRQAAQRRRRRC